MYQAIPYSSTRPWLRPEPAASVVDVVKVETTTAGVVPAGGEAAALPAVFVGGKLLGGLDRLMAVHISGELVPILKKAGALWL
uniref:Uncharacterized protein n=1 Tax=Oryza barthii TaxID=65489 RepID=A0A0D3ES93_9ORYZ